VAVLGCQADLAGLNPGLGPRSDVAKPRPLQRMLGGFQRGIPFYSYNIPSDRLVEFQNLAFNQIYCSRQSVLFTKFST
jgi:hypothetical protein